MIHDLDYLFDKKFVENDGLQNMFVETLKLKKTSVLIIFLVANQRGYALLNLSHYIQFSWIPKNFLDIEWE